MQTDPPHSDNDHAAPDEQGQAELRRARRPKARRERDASDGGKRAAMSAQENLALREPAAGYGAENAPCIAPEDTPETAEEIAFAGLSALDRDSNIARGLEVLQANLTTMPLKPGVYRFIDRRGDPIYVGKAKSLKKRVTSYTQIERLPNRLVRMVSETHSMEIVVTNTEVEALLLESNMIKRFMPRFNVLLRDDKSFPYIHISGDTDFPQMRKHRGAHTRPGDYFGPFASAGLVHRTLTALEKAFLLRTCSDTIFNQRERPCLLYQIKRCSAPCVGKISAEDYGALIEEAKAFLWGRSRRVQENLARLMQEAAEAMEFERAAKLRDRIRAMSAIQMNQDINVLGVLEDADVVAGYQAGGLTCIQVFFFRGARNYGNKSYFPANTKGETLESVMASFLAQFYDDKLIPPLILASHTPDEAALLSAALSEKAGRKVELAVPQRGEKRKLVDNAALNARQALERRQAESSTQNKLLRGMADLFGLDEPPQRIEVYDNSHIQGTHAVGGMIVAGPEGFIKNAYRKFNIRTDAAGGDDFGMMREVLTRRFARALKEDPDREKGGWPDLVLIDGGRGQLNVALEVAQELGIEDLALVGIAKGPDRNAGREDIYLPDRAPFQLPPNDPVLFYIQRLRDEAHRFAIGTHRAKRAKALVKSPLDEIAGIGPARKKALLSHFGSARSVGRASIDDLLGVEGINAKTAQLIYDHFHGS